MCFKTKCGGCGKATWAGCGNHIESALKDVPVNERCKCPRDSKKFERHNSRHRNVLIRLTQRPSLPSSQRVTVTWSSYKHHNTVKLLVSVSPLGPFTFFSKLWAGSASDKKIVKKSGFMNNLEYRITYVKIKFTP
uniref:Uncharacterized protein n=1 Tax=Magallana gigas TaxID=29159 RepID=K1QLD1_MAGGI